MTKPPTPPLGFRPEDARNAKLHLAYQRREARRDKVISRGSLVLNVLLGGAVLSMAYGAAFVLPGVRLVPLLLPALPDGSMQAAVTTDQQPVDLNQRQIRAALWQYILAHDSFSFGAAFVNRDVVKAMSTPTVWAAYDAYANPKNPNSNLAKLGRDGWVWIRRDGDGRGSLRLRNDGSGTFRVSYYRVLEGVGRPSTTTHYQQDVEFTQNYVVSAADANTFNPSSLTITAYPPPEPIGAEPGLPIPPQQLGALP